MLRYSPVPELCQSWAFLIKLRLVRTIFHSERTHRLNRHLFSHCKVCDQTLSIAIRLFGRFGLRSDPTAEPSVSLLSSASESSVGFADSSALLITNICRKHWVKRLSRRCVHFLPKRESTVCRLERVLSGDRGSLSTHSGLSLVRFWSHYRSSDSLNHD